MAALWIKPVADFLLGFLKYKGTTLKEKKRVDDALAAAEKRIDKKQVTIEDKLDLIIDSVTLLKSDYDDSKVRMQCFRNLDSIVSECVKFSTNYHLTVYMLYKAKTVKQLAHSILFGYPEITTLDIELLRSQVDAFADEAEERAAKLINSEYAKAQRDASRLQVERLLHDVLTLMKDDINGKGGRFSLLVEAFLQENLSLTIREYQKYKDIRR